MCAIPAGATSSPLLTPTRSRRPTHERHPSAHADRCRRWPAGDPDQREIGGLMATIDDSATGSLELALRDAYATLVAAEDDPRVLRVPVGELDIDTLVGELEHVFRWTL